MIDRRVGKLKKLHEEGDFLGFTEAMKEASKSLDGLEPFAELATQLADVKKDADAKAVISAQKKLAKLGKDLRELRKHKDADKLVGKIQKIAGKVSGTFAATKAEKMLAKIESMRKRLR